MWLSQKRQPRFLLQTTITWQILVTRLAETMFNAPLFARKFCIRMQKFETRNTFNLQLTVQSVLVSFGAKPCKVLLPLLPLPFGKTPCR